MEIINQKIDTDRHQHIMFKGEDGKDYATPEALRQADEAWRREHFQYISKDGRFYPTSEALDAANEAWKREHLFYIVHDAELGRREISPGTGEVQICVGHKLERDEYGKEEYIPVYRTQTF